MDIKITIRLVVLGTFSVAMGGCGLGANDAAPVAQPSQAIAGGQEATDLVVPATMSSVPGHADATAAQIVGTVPLGALDDVSVADPPRSMGEPGQLWVVGAAVERDGGFAEAMWQASLAVGALRERGYDIGGFSVMNAVDGELVAANRMEPFTVPALGAEQAQALSASVTEAASSAGAVGADVAFAGSARIPIVTVTVSSISDAGPRSHVAASVAQALAAGAAGSALVSFVRDGELLSMQGSAPAAGFGYSIPELAAQTTS